METPGTGTHSAQAESHVTLAEGTDVLKHKCARFASVHRFARTNYNSEAYQSVQEHRAVAQIGPTLAEELEELLSDGLLGAETVVVPLWWTKTRREAGEPIFGRRS